MKYALLLPFLIANVNLDQGTSRAIPLVHDEVYSGFAVPVYVEGVRVSAFINLTRKETYVNENLLVQRSESSSARIALIGQKPKAVEVVPISNPGVSVILGRSFFKGMILRWDVSNATLEILDRFVEPYEGRAISFEEGWFTYGKYQVRLPKLALSGEIPYGAPLEQGYSLTNPSEVVEAPREPLQIVAKILGALQVVVSGPQTSALEQQPILERQFVPGASFFGASEITFDFSKMRVYFKSSPKERGSQILEARLALKFRVEDKALTVLGGYRKDSQDRLIKLGLIGASVVSIADEPFDGTKLGDEEYVRRVLSMIKTNHVIEISDGKQTYRFGG